MAPLVQIKDLCKSFGQNHVLVDVSLEVSHGEVVCIIGPSGSGKTTLLNCINFLETYNSGEVRLDGELIGYRQGPNGTLLPVSEKVLNETRQHIGIVFQQFNLFPHMTALENVIEAPIHVRKMSRDVALRKGRELLARVGLSAKEDAYPARLSGGQQQRVAIARSLAMEPKVLLFDEVTSALDPELVGEVLQVMRNLAQDGLTMIVVTHEMAFARDVSNRIVFMDAGRIVEIGAPAEIFGTARTPRLKAFLNRHLSNQPD